MKRAWKTTIAAALITVTAASACVMGTYAAEPENRPGFSDSDGDGICDYAPNACLYAGTKNGCVYRDRACEQTQNNIYENNQNRICEKEHTANFVDANGDGICDNSMASRHSGQQKRVRSSRTR